MSEAGTKALAVVVVTHDSAAWLPGFFETWRVAAGGSEALRRGGVEVVVADAGSVDDTVAVVQRAGGAEVRIIACGDVGFGAAANRGVGATSAARLLVCNPDLTFPADFVRALIDPLLLPLSKDSPLWYGAACIAPRLLNPDGSVQASVGRFPTIGGVVGDQFWPREQRKYVRPQPETAGLVDWAAGACLLLRRDKFEEVGGFDERFFLYVEEVDLQRRLWAVNGQTWFAPEACVTHHAPNASRPPRAKVQRWAAQGLLRYFAKHGSAGELAAFRLLAAVSGRLGVGEVMASRRAIEGRSTK
jgi:N-acetylglucosaminyl-diphospho-decaprenol L-rhamnosyltransferase